MSHKKLMTILASAAVVVLVTILTVFLYRWEPSAVPAAATAASPQETVGPEAAEVTVAVSPEAKTETKTKTQTQTEKPLLSDSAKAALPTPPDVYTGSWRFLYVDTDHGVGRYSPELVDVDGQYFDTRVAEEARSFLNEARAQGFTPYISVGYRNFEYSIFWFDEAMLKYGSAYEAAQHVNPPGTTEHSTGLAFDITDNSYYAANYSEKHDPTAMDSELYQWMAEHCQEYGFIVRYPEGKEEYFKNPCYHGHFRYVGVEAATYIMENDLCLEEFLALYE